MPQETATRRSHLFSPEGSSNHVVVPLASQEYGLANGGGVNHSERAVPGRARKRRGSTAKRKGRLGFWSRCYKRFWCKDLVQSFSSLLLAVVLWYSLGVISIGSSKLLLTATKEEGGTFGGVSPLFLTLQQLLIGSTLLRFLLKVHFLSSPGLQPLSTTSSSSPASRNKGSSPHLIIQTIQSYPPQLFWAGLCFSMGFLATNYGFSGASAAFVETIKAAEPITSATVAVWWGIEVLSQQEMASLATIVAGVLLSTLGNQHGNSGDSSESSSTLSDTAVACLVVMSANLCFSFRGLFQKLFRATSSGRLVDDLNLQFRMQQLGVMLLFVPAVFMNLPTLLSGIGIFFTTHGMLAHRIVLKYSGLALINGIAFTSYNLASTYILSRISVVHHAALNCIRRIFAIVVTSIAFDVPITIIGGMGILLSFFGFMSFTHFKVQRQRTPKPVSSLLPVSAAVK